MFRDAERQVALESDDPTPSMQRLALKCAKQLRAERIQCAKSEYYRGWHARYRGALDNSPLHGPHRR
jgi:hypothetical protein